MPKIRQHLQQSICGWVHPCKNSERQTLCTESNLKQTLSAAFPSVCKGQTIRRCNEWVLLSLCKNLHCIEDSVLTSAHIVAPCVCIASPQQVHNRSACPPCSFLPCLFPHPVFSFSPPPSALSLLFSEDLL